MKSPKTLINTLFALFVALFAGVSVAQAQDVQTINLIGTNQMKYTVASKKPYFEVGKSVKGDNGQTEYLLKSVTVKAGQKVKVVMHNNTSLPANAMSHNFVLLTMNADATQVANKSAQAKDNDYVAASEKDQIIAHTEMVAGGKTSSVTFTAPEKKGDYTFICTFPGHYQAGMHATLKVE